LLDEGWSPEQIAGRLAHEAGLKQVSAPTICQVPQNLDLQIMPT
jgi:hypothetical protein